MDVNIVCFAFFAALYVGYLILEGFTYGAGIVLPFFGKTDIERQTIINTTAPIWEGNEVWLVASGAVLFAAFPNVYAVLFSGLYLAVFLILTSLILRGVAFEFRNKDANPSWRTFWDWSIFAGSLIPALLWGVAIASLSQGLPVDSTVQYAGTLADAINPYTIIGGVLFIFVFSIHGILYLTLKLEPYLIKRANQAGLRLCRFTLLCSLLFVLLTCVYTDLLDKPIKLIPLFLSVLGIFLINSNLKAGRYTRCFIINSAIIILLAAIPFTGSFPKIIESSLNPLWSLDIYNSAANPLTLKIMSAILAIVLPTMIAYQIWKYYIFRRRITVTETEFGSDTEQLERTHQQLKQSIEIGHCFVDVMENIILALRSKDGDGSINKKLKYKHQVMLKLREKDD